MDNIWAINANKLAEIHADIMSRSEQELIQARAEIRKAQDAGLPIMARNGTAEIRIAGPITKRMSMWTFFMGGTSYLGIQASLNAALSDRSIDRIMLHIESPGGNVAGMAEAGDAIRAADAIKPVTAYIDDLGASAAYYLAANASEIRASRMASVGSIGVYALLYDDSEMFKQAGIKVIQATTSDMKLIGAPGVEITDAMRAEVLKHIDEWGAEFSSTVMRGRRMDAKGIEAVANGRVFVADEARRLGLVDEVSSFDEMRSILDQRHAQQGRARTARALVAKMSMA